MSVYMHLTHGNGTWLAEYKYFGVQVEDENCIMLRAGCGKEVGLIVEFDDRRTSETLSRDELTYGANYADLVKVKVPRLVEKDVRATFDQKVNEVTSFIANGMNVIKFDLAELARTVADYGDQAVENLLEEAKELEAYVGERISRAQRFLDTEEVESLRRIRGSLQDLAKDGDLVKLDGLVDQLNARFDEEEERDD